MAKKKRHHSSPKMVERPNYGRTSEMKRDVGGYQEVSNERSGMKKVMMPNNPSGSFIKEDWNERALAPRGVKEIALGTMKGHKSGRLGDLYSQVEKTTREDQQAFDKLTDPTNW